MSINILLVDSNGVSVKNFANDLLKKYQINLYLAVLSSFKDEANSICGDRLQSPFDNLQKIEYISGISAEEIYLIANKNKCITIFTVDEFLTDIVFQANNNIRNLPNVNYSSKIFRNKSLMGKFLSYIGIPYPHVISAGRVSDLGSVEIPEEFFPSVVKPVDSSGSSGVLTVRNKKELEEYNLYYKSIHPLANDAYIVQQLIVGDEYSADLFIYQSSVVFQTIAKKYTTNFCVEVGHDVNHSLSKTQHLKLQKQIQSLINNLGIKNGCIHYEFIIDKDNNIICMEFGLRNGGGGLPKGIEAAHGINIYEIILILTINKDPREYINKNIKNRFSFVRYILPTEKYSNLNIPANEPMFKDLDYIFIRKTPMANSSVKSNSDRIGYIVLSSETPNPHIPGIENINRTLSSRYNQQIKVWDNV